MSDKTQPSLQERADQYNMPKGSRHRAAYRFTADGWRSIMLYANWAIERAEKSAKATPKLELLKEMRHIDLQCGRCKRTGRIGGAAMTTSECDKCHRFEMYGSTATPTYCRNCAFAGLMCQYCGNELDEGTFA